MKRLMTILLLLLGITCGTAPAQDEPALTLMVYLCGSNLETDAGAATADLTEMMAHYPADGSVRVIVMASGSRKWHTDVTPEETAIYELTGAGLEKLSSLPLQSMGDPAALTALLDYGYAHAPAQQYALLLWNHGAGPALGLCFDELFSTETTMDGLTLPELSRALAESPAAQQKLSWIGFDACLMASLETACSVAPYAQYMIASQETEPASGWCYSFLSAITDDASGQETGRRIIDAYFDSLSDSLAAVTLSCVDLQAIPPLTAAMDTLFNHLHLSLNNASYAAFADCRINTKSLGCSTAYEYDLVDLTDLMQVYQASGLADCTELLSLLDQAIIDSRSSMPYINGLSIHYPHYGLQPDTTAAAPSGYAAFMDDMSAIRLGEPLTDWTQRHTPQADLTDGLTTISMALTQQQADNLDFATLYIIKQMAGDDWQLVYKTNDVTLTDSNILEATYREQALFLMDAQGEAFSTAIPYSLQDGAVVLSGMLTRGFEDVTEDWYAFVKLIFRQDAQGDYRLCEVQEHTTDPTRQGKTTIRLEDYTSLSLFRGSSTPAYAADGSLLPPGQWPLGDLSYGYWFDLADFPGWSIDFLSQQDGRSRFALLEMTDTQNNIICSELVPIPNPNVIDLPVQAQLLTDNEYCRVTFSGAQKVYGLHPALRLIFTCENRHTERITANLEYLQLDSMIISHFSGSSPAIDPGATKSFEVEIPQEDLQRLALQSSETMQMTINIKQGYSDTLLETHASCLLASDLRDIAPAPVTPEILTADVWNGLEFSLYDLHLQDDETLSASFQIRNLSDEPRQLNTASFYLDGVTVNGHLTDAISTLEIRPGACMHMDATISLKQASADLYSRFLLEALGGTHLHTLGVGVYHDSYQEQDRLEFTLSQPLALPVNTEKAQSAQWPLLYDKDGVTIRLTDLTWQQDSEYQTDYRYINLCISNSTDHDLTLYIPWRLQEDSPNTFLANGISLDYVHSPGCPANTISMGSIWYTIGEGYETMESLDFLMNISAADGRDDWIIVRIRVQDEPRTDGEYRILSPAQLKVTVTPAN